MKRPVRLFMVVASAALIAGACNSTPVAEAPGSGGAASATSAPVSDADKQWTSQNKNPASTRYSAVSEINATNVKNLKVAWSFSTGVLRGHEGGPLVVGSTMY